MAAAGLDPLDHYLQWGAAEDRDPSPLFVTAFYRAVAADAGVPVGADAPGRRWRRHGRRSWPETPLEHYVRVGRARGLRPTPWHDSPLFDPAWYATASPDLAGSGLDPLEHFLRVGRAEGRAPTPWHDSPAFDPGWYRATYADVAAVGHDPLANWLVFGRHHGRQPHPAVADGWFDGDWYLSAYPDVRSAPVVAMAQPGEGERSAAWWHYVTWGAREGRDPSPWFSTTFYAAQYPGVAAGDALADFLARRSADGLAAARRRLRARWSAELDRFLAEGRTLDLRWPAENGAGPAVSVVVVAWNQAAATLACLTALRAATIPLQVLLVDNASTDETADLLARFQGISLLRNESNLGFVDAVNQALPAVAAPAVLLLNNDAALRPGALEAALESLAGADIAAVGGRVVLPTGLLQEAGCLVWPDGSAQGYLRGQPWQHGPAMHARDVDFCSGAFLLLDTAAVRSAGGLSERFRPAYGEEADLCLRLRASGLRTVYDPRVVVDHLEFGSAPDAASALALQDRAKAALAERHAGELASRPMPAATRPAVIGADVVALAEWPSRRRERVLVLDDLVPRESAGAGYPRTLALLRALLASGRQVTLIPLEQSAFADWKEVRREVPLTVEVVPEPGWRGLHVLLRQRAGTYDLLWASREHTWRRVLALREAEPGLLDGVRLVYDTEALAPLRAAGRAALGGAAFAEGLNAALHGAAEAARAADAVVAVTAAEADLLRRLGVARVHVLGHAVAGPPTPEDTPGRAGLLFVGSLAEPGSPNVDSLRWLAEEVLPALRDLPGGDAGLTVVGRLGPEAEFLRDVPGIRLAGPVADARPALAAARVFLAPTRFGAGLPLKVVQAAALGVPVVATPLVARQLGWSPGREVMVGMDAGSFAAAVSTLLVDDARWQAVRAAALSAAQAYAPDRFAADLAAVLAP